MHTKFDSVVGSVHQEKCKLWLESDKGTKLKLHGIGAPMIGQIQCASQQ